MQALTEISFSVEAGERVAVVGPSGAGKSTLLQHLNGLLPETPLPKNSVAETAPVVVANLPTTAQHLAEIRRNVGLLFQDPDDQLFCPTVIEDVAFGPLNLGLSSDEARQRAQQALASVDLADYEERSTLQLSVGEKKRVCLAGVFACSPQILALDEPTGNLDPRARRLLLTILDQTEVTQIIATHDLEFVVEHCNRVLILDEGQLCADGDPATVLANKDLMTKHGLEVPLSIRFRS